MRNADVISDVELQPLELDVQNSLRRQSPRPEHLRGPDYWKKFDDLTVFYDCFHAADGRNTIMLGPPMFNLERTVRHVLRRTCGLPWFSRIAIRRFDRHAQLWIGSVDRVNLPLGLFQQDSLTIQPNCSELFRGRRVVLTLSRNNELQWIKDWTHFFVRKHGADAILLYDNASTKYTSDEIREVINSVPGVELGIVVDWPYRYGDVGLECGHYDSDYCQYGVLEHARHRFLAHAQAVVNSDIDELPITAGGEPLFNIALRSKTGYLNFGGYWVENASLSAGVEISRRHKDYVYRSTRQSIDTKCEAGTHKWTVIPSRCGSNIQWKVHMVTELAPDPLSSLVRFRHFKAINTNWNNDRWQPEMPNEYDHTIDEELQEWLRVF